MCVCVVKDGSCDFPSTSYVHKTMLMWITWPASGPGPPVDDAEGIKNCFTFSTKCYFSSRAQFWGFFSSAFIGNTSWMRHISEEMWGELSVTEKYTLLTFKKWHSGSLLVLGKNKHWESFQKQLEEVTTIIICLWRSHCNIQLSVNGRDRLLSRSISHYLTVASWGKKKKAIYKQWRLTICTGLIKHIFLIIKEKKKRYKQIFPFDYVHRAKRRCWKMIEHLVV